MKSVGNVFILGDSYSTFKGYIPEGYATYYGDQEREGIDVYSVDETWWMQVINRASGNLVMNCSWSGTTIGNHGWNNEDYKDISFIGRVSKLIAEGYFEKKRVDTFFLFGGTNDCWCGAPLGEKKTAEWSNQDLYFAIPAIYYLAHLLKQELKGIRVIGIINTRLKPPIKEALIDAFSLNEIEYVELEDIEKAGGHPNKKGMEQIAEQVLAII